MSTTTKLVLILISFGFVTAFYSSLIPPFEGPDSPEHFAYVVWLARWGELPPQGEAAWETPVRQQASQPPFYYFLAALPAWLGLDVAEPAAVYRPNPHFPSDAAGHIPDNKNIAIYYAGDGWSWRGEWRLLSLSRLLSLAFGLILVAATFGLAREIRPANPHFALAAAAIVAVNPQVIFLSGVVSNDIAAAALGAVVLWQLAGWLRRGPTVGRGLLLGFVFGLALLSKSNSLALALPLAVAWGWGWLRYPTARWSLILSGVSAAVIALATAGWWYARNWTLYGSPLGLDAHYLAPWALGEEGQRAGWLAEWLEVFYSFWAAFGWGNIKWPGWVYLPLLLLCLLAVGGLVKAALQYDRQWRSWPVWPLVLAAAVVGVVVALEVWMQQVRAPHGRLLFPALAAAAVLLVAGWRAIHSALPAAGIGYLLLLTLLAPGQLIRPAYAPPQPLSPEEIAALPDPLNWRYGQVAELHSAVPLERSVQAGESLPLQLCWTPLARSKRDYTALIQLVGPDNQVVARRATYPGLGLYPTSQWRPGETFCDLVRVNIPDDLARTLLYQVEVIMLDWTEMERLPLFDAQDGPRDHAFVAAARLAADTPVAPPPAGPPIQLREYQVNDQWPAGDAIPLTFTWQLAAEVERDYTLFIHLRPPDSQTIAAQADGPPLAGWYPTSWWEVGEIVEDERIFDVPAALEAGSYDLVVGWYDPQSGQRLGEERFVTRIEVAP